MTTNEENESCSKILRKLWHNKIFSIVIILLNIFAMISTTAYSIIESAYREKKEMLNITAWFTNVFRISLFIINAMVLSHYYKMAPFFIQLIQDDPN